MKNFHTQGAQLVGQGITPEFGKNLLSGEGTIGQPCLSVNENLTRKNGEAWQLSDKISFMLPLPEALPVIKIANWGKHLKKKIYLA